MTTDHDKDAAVSTSPLLMPELHQLFAESIRANAAISPARAARPRRLFALSVTGVAASTCVALIVFLGGPASSGLLSPQRAVAAAVEALDSNAVLHWVRRDNLATGPGANDPREIVIDEQWVDLANGDSHSSSTATPGTAAARTNESWVDAGELWTRLPAASGDRQTIRRVPGAADPAVPGAVFSPITSVNDVRSILERADRGDGEIAEAGEDNGTPLVVVTNRVEGVERRTWITREKSPRVVKITTSVASRRSETPVTTTTITETWEILPRSDEALEEVAIPSTVDRLP